MRQEVVTDAVIPMMILAGTENTTWMKYIIYVNRNMHKKDN